MPPDAIPLPAPRVPRIHRFRDEQGEWEHVGYVTEMVCLLCLTGGGIAVLWGAWTFACWIVRVSSS